MKIHLNVGTDLGKRCCLAGRAVEGLEWVERIEEADGVLTDQVPREDRPRPALFLGSIPELTRSAGSIPNLGPWFSVGLPRRYEPAIQGLYRSHRQGELGELGLLRAHRWLAGGINEARRQQERVALIDVVVWLFGGLPDTVYALRHQDDNGLQVHLSFPGAGMAMLDWAWSLPDGKNYDSIHLIGDRGAAYADDHRNMALLYSGDDPRALTVGNPTYGMATLLQAFVDSISAHKPMVSLAEVLQVQKVVDAVQKSLEAHEVCRLREVGGKDC